MKIPTPQLAQIRAKAEGGNPESQFLLSQICQQDGDIAGMANWLREACANGVADAHTALGHCHEKGIGVDRSAVSALELYTEALELGSVSAAYRRAELLYKSRRGPDHEDEIRALLNQAAMAGFEPARRAIAYLAAQAGIPGTELTPTVALYPTSRTIERHDLNDDPPVAMFMEVLNTSECAYLVALSRPFLKRSDVIDPDSRQDGMTSSVRTSSGTYLPFHLVDIISRYIEQKIILASGEDLDRSEPMSILRYEPGEYYLPHFDYFDPRLTVSEGLLEDGGQRTASAVTYLSIPSAGGGTRFPKLGLAVAPAPGATLWFRNCDSSGNIDPRSLHAGDAVDTGEKWVVTKWFREEQTSYLEL